MTPLRQQAGRPEGGEFAPHSRTEDAISLVGRPYSAMAVNDIDAELSGYYDKLYPVTRRIHSNLELIRDMEAWIQNPRPSDYGAWRYKDPETQIDKAREQILVDQAAAEKIRDEEIKPIDDEFEARGGWTRFFLVTGNTGGHVHRSMSCSTCFATTQFVWLYNESGKNEDEIVERAGDGACTVCYPSAPVADRNNPRPNPFEDPAVTEKRRVREEEKAVRDATKLAKGIFTETGETLREAPDLNPDGSVRYRGREVKTERGAELRAVDLLTSALWSAEHAKTNGRDQIDPNSEHAKSIARRRAQEDETVAIITEALARKRGQTVEEIKQLITDKAAAKFKRENK